MSKFNFRKIIILVIILTFSVAIITPAHALTDEQEGYISQNCTTIKQSLKTLQKVDTRTRAYLGGTYAAFLKDFITPLNLRLVKNNQPNPDLTDLHAEIITAREKFSKSFTTYSKSFETLLNTDCQSDPTAFYDQLEDTRKKRASLESTTKKLNSLFTAHLDIVKVMEFK